MILIDYSQILVAAALAQSSEFQKGGDTKRMAQIIRHVVLTSLLNIKKDNTKKYGKMIVCADGSKNWRKTVFPYYKYHRAGSRDESTNDWGTIFGVGGDLRDEIKETFPFHVVREDTAEADDVVATLVKYSQDNETIQVGLEEEPQKVLAVSSDGDFKQLYKYRNYAQWSPIQKKVVGKPEKTFLLEKILTGDKGDGVPNVRSRDDILLSDDRQKPITAKMKQAYFDAPDGSTLTTEERRNLDRNRMMIDFDCIPAEVAEKILVTYKESKPKVDKNAVFEYFVAHRMRSLTNSLQDFF